VNVTAWRIYKKRHARSAFTGEGARRFGGRWNSPGHTVIYLAQSQALAALEMLVHLEAADALKHYQMCPVTFSSAMVENLDPATLPANWRKDPSPKKVRAIGNEWIESGRSLVLRVPSAIVAAEHNFLLNPTHKDFPRIGIGKPERFKFDRRLLAP
jgi:RES domain-containing protein